MRKITASDGYVYTQAQETPIESMIFAKELYLGISDFPDNWREIPEEEAKSIEEERQRITEEQRLAEQLQDMSSINN
jgi:hypothetical protein